jgi:heptosyltransferase-2
VLERGHGLAFELPFFPDEDPAMLCEFFGEITAVSQKASAFATLTQSAVLPVWCRMDDEGMTLEIAPPLEDHASAEDLTLALVAHFEKRIRATPAEMDWDAECWDPPLESLLPSRSPWKLALRPNQTLADLKPYRILARVPDSVREACLCIPAIRALKRGREDVHLTVLTTAAMAPMWQQLAECDACLALEAAASEGKTFSLGIVFDRDDKQALSQIQRHSVARVIGMENHPSAEKFDDMLSMPRKLGPPEHRNRTNLRLAHRLGADVVHDADLRSPVIANTTASQSLTVGVAPDSDDGPTYAWPTERYLEVVLRMSKANPSITWRILIHEQTDPSAWETLRSELGSDILTIVLGASSIEEQLVALRGCALLLSNDNDFLHLAAAMYGMPSIAIYGPSEPIESAPTSSLSLTLRRHVECTPCFLKECPLDHRCLNEIDVDEATAALETSLARLTA